MNRYIDHTLLKPHSTLKQITLLCDEAEKHEFASVCIHPHYIKKAAETLGNSKVKVCTVIGFPLGANQTETKIFEARKAIEDGADECDMVINVGWLKDKLYDKLIDEISQTKSAIGKHVLKVIVEISLLTDNEIAKISQIVSDAGADFIKTSTGFGSHGATLDAIKIMKDNISDQTQIKASGGIRDYQTAKAFIDIGVTRLGTSSGVEILEGETSNKSY